MKKSLTKDKLLAEGKKLFDVGKYKDAIKFYTKALAIAPKFSEAYNQRGIAYSYLNDYEQAIYNFTTTEDFVLRRRKILLWRLPTSPGRLTSSRNAKNITLIAGWLIPRGKITNRQ